MLSRESQPLPLEKNVLSQAFGLLIRTLARGLASTLVYRSRFSHFRLDFHSYRSKIGTSIALALESQPHPSQSSSFLRAIARVSATLAVLLSAIARVSATSYRKSDVLAACLARKSHSRSRIGASTALSCESQPLSVVRFVYSAVSSFVRLFVRSCVWCVRCDGLYVRLIFVCPG